MKTTLATMLGAAMLLSTTAATAEPIKLTDTQMDSVTAGSAILNQFHNNLDLNARKVGHGEFKGWNLLGAYADNNGREHNLLMGPKGQLVEQVFNHWGGNLVATIRY